jgi:hypothetical protein
MQEQRTRECHGCSAPVPVKDIQRRSWCARCRPIASDFYSIERVGRLLEHYGQTRVAVEIAVALEAIQEQLRTDAGPACAIAVDAAARVEQRRADRDTHYAAVDEIVESKKLATDERPAEGILIYLADRRTGPSGSAGITMANETEGETL